MSNHSIVHVEISSKDLEGTIKFYGELFGWQIQAMPEMNYALFQTSDEMGGGFSPVDNQTYKAGDVIVYVSTDDVEASLAKAESLGGKKLMGKTEVPGFGWFGMFLDPTGNRIGLWTAAPRNGQ